MFLFIFIAVYCLYAIFICRWLNYAFNYKFKYLEVKDNENLEEIYKPFDRYDFKKWPKYQMYLVGIFLLPFRIFVIVSNLIFVFIIIRIATIGLKKDQDITPFRNKIISLGRLNCRIILFFGCGVYWIKEIHCKVKDYDPSYPEQRYKEKQWASVLLKNFLSCYQQEYEKIAPILVSNHITFLDIFYFAQSKFRPGFLAKKGVSRYPIAGTIARGLSSLYVERGDRKQMDECLDQIAERVTKVNKKGVSLPKLMIFPEGTTSNGKYLISFKRGSFINFNPVQICALKYTNENFNPCMDCMPEMYPYIFTLLQFSNPMTAYIFETYYPDHLKETIQDQNNPKNWKIYSEKVKEIMGKAIGAKLIKTGFANKAKFRDQIFLPGIKKQLENQLNLKKQQQQDVKKEN